VLGLALVDVVADGVGVVVPRLLEVRPPVGDLALAGLGRVAQLVRLRLCRGAGGRDVGLEVGAGLLLRRFCTGFGLLGAVGEPGELI
jgi:hypothetical protein